MDLTPTPRRSLAELEPVLIGVAPMGTFWTNDREPQTVLVESPESPFLDVDNPNIVQLGISSDRSVLDQRTKLLESIGDEEVRPP